MAKDRRHSFEDTLQELKHKEPFSPFTVIMASGDRYRIEDPDMMINSPVEIIYVVPHSGRVVRLRKTQVVAIEENSEKHAA